MAALLARRSPDGPGTVCAGLETQGHSRDLATAHGTGEMHVIQWLAHLPASRSVRRRCIAASMRGYSGDTQKLP